MTGFSFLTSSGPVGVELTSTGLLSRVVWNAATPEADTSGKLDAFWEQWKRRLVRFFEAGEPIGDFPFDRVDWSSCSDFQKQVYAAVVRIPHGETRSYSWAASRVGKPGASRAIGQALRKNPVPILIPCHRVVAAEGGMVGFMGKSDPRDPELALKKRLIEIERMYRNPVFPFVSDLFKMSSHAMDDASTRMAPLSA